MGRVKRDNRYYLDRIEAEHPATYKEVLDGKISVQEARRRHKMGGERTRLHELKNAWVKGSQAQRDEFLTWLRGRGDLPAIAGAATPARTPVARSTRIRPSPVILPAGSGVPGSVFDSSGRLTADACKRILHVMDARGMKSGDLCDELGLKRLDASVMMAVRRGNVLAATTQVKLEKWLAANSAV